MLAVSMLVFALGVAACGMAGSFTAVVVWRFVQGMAGGLLILVSLIWFIPDRRIERALRE